MMCLYDSDAYAVPDDTNFIRAWGVGDVGEPPLTQLVHLSRSN